MDDFIQRARGMFSHLVGRRSSREDDAASPEVAGNNIGIAGGLVMFLDATRAAAEPAGWLTLFGVAAARNLPVSPSALAIIADHVSDGAITSLVQTEGTDALLGMLRPRAGLAERLSEMRRCGLLGRMFPDNQELALEYSRQNDDRAMVSAFAAVAFLETLLTEHTLTAQRFGAMLRELGAPEALVLSILLAPVTGWPKTDASGTVRAAATRLGLPPEVAHATEFLVQNRARMSQLAVRQDTGDPEVIRQFAALFSTEEQLKMLTLLAVADRRLGGGDGLTPWKSELLWRLFVDAYNELTLAYGDQVIDRADAALALSQANRPADISAAELTSFLEGFPRRYLTLFDPATIYQHVELCRTLGADEVHSFVQRRDDSWDLTIVTLDKPHLFSNVCAVLSHLNLDIVRARALTSQKSVVIDVFQFVDRKGTFDASRLGPLLADVIAGRQDAASLFPDGNRGGQDAATGKPSPLIYFDNDASSRYTVLEVVVSDAPGLLHRLARAISAYGCDLELVLVSTEGERAVDVFHLTRGQAKLSDSDQLALTGLLERSLDPLESFPPAASEAGEVISHGEAD